MPSIDIRTASRPAAEQTSNELRLKHKGLMPARKSQVAHHLMSTKEPLKLQQVFEV
jgi:hypothetical protein